ncbi:GIY-YIG nuclease family protein [Candidatus Microgenomates bacterium]|nr:GIY-YIG nuclease family protein [Candidatus Microgenomates bacterium]
MFYVYLLRSKIKNWVYVGMTGDLNERVKRHNLGREKTTRSYRPFELIFVQEFNERETGRDLEKFLKVRWNKEGLLSLIAGVVKW